MELVKDTVFKLQFGYTDYCAELYNYVTGTSDATADNITYCTLNEEDIGTALRNDLSFLVGEQLVMFSEAQSTYPYNMPLRMFLYCAEVYKKLLRIRKVNIHHSTNVKLPSPRFCVIYTGSGNTEDVMTLSDMFETPCPYGEGMELITPVIRMDKVVKDYTAPACVTDYMLFCNIYDSVRKEHPNWDKHTSVRTVKQMCVNHNILKRVLTDYGKEFDDCMSAWFTHEEEMQWLREEYLREGLEKGREEGRKERDIEFVKILKDIESGKLPVGEVLRRMSKVNSAAAQDAHNINLDSKGV